MCGRVDGAGVAQWQKLEVIGNGQERTIGAQGGAALVLGGGEWSNEGLGGGWGGGSGWERGWAGRGAGRRG